MQFLREIFLLHMGEHAGHYHILTIIDLLHDSQEVRVLGPYKGPHTRVLWGCLGWFQRESLGAPLMLFMPHSHSIVNIHPGKNRLHSCLWAVFHPGCYFFISPRNNWDWRTQSATLLEQPVLWVNSFIRFHSIAKLP